MIPIEDIAKAAYVDIESYQLKAATSEHKNQVWWWTRKGGKTTTLAMREARLLLNESVPGVGYSGGIGLLSNGADQAKAVLQVTKFILSNLGWTFTQKREQVSEDAKLAYSRAFEIQMPNMNRLMALASGDDAANVRPYSFHELQIDEADFQNEEVFVATEACTARFNGPRILASTQHPYGDTNTYFMKRALGKYSGWEISKIKATMVGHIPKAWLVRMKREMRPDDFGREFMLELNQATNRIIDRKLFASCVEKQMTKITPMFEHQITFLGVDFARFGKDDNVIAFCHWDGTHGYVHAKVYPGKNTRTTEIVNRIMKWVDKYPQIKRIVTDDNGVGAGPTDTLVQELGPRKVLGITNHRRTDNAEGTRKKYIREDLYMNLLRQMEWQKLTFERDTKLERSLLGLTWEYNQHGLLSIRGIETHIAEAIVRAIFPLASRRAWRFERGMIAGIARNDEYQSPLNEPEDRFIIS